MGNTQSTIVDINKIVANAISNAYEEITSNCTSNSGLNITLDISKLRAKTVNIGSLTQDATSNLNLTCVQANQITDSVQNDIANKVTSALESTTTGYNSSQTFIESRKDFETNFITNFDAKTMSDCMINQFTTAEMSLYDIGDESTDAINISNLSQTVLANATNNCVQSNQKLTESINKLQTEASTTAKSTTTGLDLTSNSSLIFSSSSCSCSLLVILVGAYIYMKSKGG